jgi:organic radical activating enzyme
MKVPVLYQIEAVPITVIIDICNSCNAKCPFCTRQLSETVRKDFMTKEMFYEIMEQVEKIPTINTISLAAWGEPLLHPNFDEFIDYIKSKRYTVTFPTNLSLAHKHFNAMLKTDHLMFSIEGFDKESYEKSRVDIDYNRIVWNITAFDKLIQKRNENGQKVPKRDLNFLLTKESKIEQFINLWGKYVDEIRVGPVLPMILWNKEMNSFKLHKNKDFEKTMLPCKNFVKNMFCQQPFNIVTVRANGNLALCCSDYDSEMDFGSYKNLWYDFMNNPNLNKIRQEFKTGKLNVCKNCFQNFEIPKDMLFEELPELKKYENDKKVVIYTNR